MRRTDTEESNETRARKRHQELRGTIVIFLDGFVSTASSTVTGDVTGHKLLPLPLNLSSGSTVTMPSSVEAVVAPAAVVRPVEPTWQQLLGRVDENMLARPTIALVSGNTSVMHGCRNLPCNMQHSWEQTAAKCSGFAH